MRKREVLDETDEALPARVGLTGPELERMYRLLAIANYEDRYVIPQAHAELGERLMQEQGGCGLDFAGGPGNCGAVDPRPDTSSPHVPYDGESFHLVDILTRESAGREAPPTAQPPPWALLSFAAALPGRAPARAGASCAPRSPRCPAGAVRDALERFLAALATALTARARYVETFDLRRRATPRPHLLRATATRASAAWRCCGSRSSTAPPGCRWTRAELPDHLDGHARVRRARPDGYGEALLAEHRAGDRAAAAVAARPRQPLRARARRGRRAAAAADASTERAEVARLAARGPARGGGRPRALRPPEAMPTGARHERRRDPAVDHPPLRRDGDVRRRAPGGATAPTSSAGPAARPRSSSTRSSAGPGPAFHYGALAAIGGHVIGLMIPKSFTETRRDLREHLPLVLRDRRRRGRRGLRRRLRRARLPPRRPTRACAAPPRAPTCSSTSC